MKTGFRKLYLLCCGLALVGISLPQAGGVEPSKRSLRPGEFNPADDSVDLFAAAKAGQIEVRVVPKDTTGGRVLITNKTDRPLNIKLPDAFAGVHVLAQFGGGAASGGMGGGGAQGMGGGGMGGGGGMAGGGGGGGMFNIAPEKVGNLSFVGVCLEHGKPDPRAVMKYEMRPLDTLSSKPEVRELLTMLGRGQCSQRVAQVLAWHVNNGMSWEELAAKRIERLDGTSEPYFTTVEMQAAQRLGTHITRELEAREKGETLPKL